jgi:hypothetical protein
VGGVPHAASKRPVKVTARIKRFIFIFLPPEKTRGGAEEFRCKNKPSFGRRARA